MTSAIKRISLVCSVLLAACAANESSPSQTETRVSAIGETVTTDAASYTLGATITVTYSGLPGNARDWIAIAPAGSDNSNYIAWVYTNGQVSGTATFPAPSAGSYVARAFVNDTFTLLAESASFAVLASAPISTDHSTYSTGSTITVTYSGLPGNPQDWIAIAAAGSANTSFVAYVYTNGQTSGTATFTAPGTGSYVARSFLNNGYTLFAESAAFSVTPAVSTDSAAYATGATVTVTYAGLPGNYRDWIAIAPAGSDNLTYVTYVYTNGQVNGTATFAAPAPGSYVARAFVNDTFTLAAESTPFTVAAAVTI
ncbi:MAG TPA: hypothetical protein VN903_11245, partial [Polyangia bacterium]|nr:hypothetical protein [Polyangia bacterium]